MPLSDLTLSLQYRSDQNVLSRDLYERCLQHSSVFMRAVGFFSSSVFTTCPQAFHSFFKSNGRMQLVCSPILSRKDIDALQRGYRDRPALVRKPRLDILLGSPKEVANELGELLAWLVASRHFDLKVAVVQDGFGQEIYHEKLGIFEDDKGYRVAFTGSVNESKAALQHNFEVADIFRSWQPADERRVARKVADFEALWNSETSGLAVYSFPEAARLGLLRPHNVSESIEYLNSEDSHQLPPMIGQLPGLEETLGIPIELKLRSHQIRAIREWFEKSGRGIFEMATGSGKTITALATAAKLYESIGAPLLIVIVCPYLHLVTQWIEQARRFGLDPLPCAVARSRWQEEFSVRLYNMAVGNRLLSSVITSNATFSSEAFQNLLRRFPIRLLLIADEVHNLGAEQTKASLPPNAAYRLGLSATPERWFDPTGTQALTDYFGPTLVHYTLREALTDEVLCPYRYYPQLVQLTDEEFDEYYELTVSIARLLGKDKDIELSSRQLEALLIRRARLIATASGKLQALELLLTPRRQSTHNLVYCGDGTVEVPSEQSVERQINAVTRLLGAGLGMTVSKYTAETPLSRRDVLRSQFASGEVQCLVAIRCLDEGVDIPETQRAFILASSSNPRQFIQRRGRLLRTSPGKEIAEVFDFVVEPPLELSMPGTPYYPVTRRLVGKELLRVIEFAKLAVNGPEALHQLLDLRNRLNLLDLGIEEHDI